MQHVGDGRLPPNVSGPPSAQGRAAATITFAGMGLAPLGSLLGGYLADECGLRTSLLATAAGMMLSPLLMALSPLARLGRELPSPTAAPPAERMSARPRAGRDRGPARGPANR